MALDKPALKTAIINLLTDMLTREENSIDEYAGRLADAIEAFVKTGNVEIGITVNTTGTATAQTGKTTTQGSIV